MYRRVIVPMGLAVGAAVALWTLSGLASVVDKRALEMLSRGSAGWMLPVLPNADWLVFLAVFFGVRLCALRGGDRRECIAVGASLVVLYSLLSVVLLWQVGFGSLLAVFGDTAPVQNHQVTLGAAVAARTYAARLLGLAGTCLAATWLYFFMVRPRSERVSETAAG